MNTSYCPQQPEIEDASEDAHCDRHGAYKSRVVMVFDKTVIKSQCPQCSEESRARTAEQSKLDEQRRAVAQTHARFSAAGMPSRFSDRTFDNYVAETSPQQFVLKAARVFEQRSIDVPGLSMIFTGRCGTGKNHLAAACARDFANKGRSVLFKTTLQLVRYIKTTYSKTSDKTEAQAYADLLRPDLLIVDEVGIALGTDHEKTVLWEVLNDRYAHERSTILLTNLNKQELTRFLGERLVDRYAECGVILAFDWESHRSKVLYD